MKSSTLATELILPPSKEDLLLKKQNWFVLPYKKVMKSVKKKNITIGRPCGTTLFANVFAKASEFTIWVNSRITKQIKIELNMLEHCTL